MAKPETLAVPAVTLVKFHINLFSSTHGLKLIKLQEDLHSFQLRHFGSLSPASDFLAQVNPRNRNDDETQLDADADADVSDEDADGLGYYPDGVKRTLTDEQIAMFRHSEIYNLLRDKRLQAEREEIGQASQNAQDEEVSQARLFVSGDSVNEEVIALKKEGPPVCVDLERAELKQVDDKVSDEDDDEEYIRFLLEEKKQQVSDAARKKRKRRGEHRGKGKAQDHTHRRIARELDTSTYQETFLDYDDGPDDKASVSPKNHGQMVGQAGRPSNEFFSTAR